MVNGSLNEGLRERVTPPATTTTMNAPDTTTSLNVLVGTWNVGLFVPKEQPNLFTFNNEQTTNSNDNPLRITSWFRIPQQGVGVARASSNTNTNTNTNTNNATLPDLIVLGFQELQHPIFTLIPGKYSTKTKSFIRQTRYFSTLAPGYDQHFVAHWIPHVFHSIDQALNISCASTYTLHVTHRSIGRGIILLSRNDSPFRVQNIRIGSRGSGFLGVYGNKGSIGASFDIIRHDNHNARLSLCFMNNHLEAHAGVKHFKSRNEEVKYLLDTLLMRSKSRQQGSLKPKCPRHHDFVFFLGDLNYRLTGFVPKGNKIMSKIPQLEELESESESESESPSSPIPTSAATPLLSSAAPTTTRRFIQATTLHTKPASKTILYDIIYSQLNATPRMSMNHINVLLELDELNNVKPFAFMYFSEAPITFPPSYKFLLTETATSTSSTNTTRTRFGNYSRLLPDIVTDSETDDGEDLNSPTSLLATSTFSKSYATSRLPAYCDRILFSSSVLSNRSSEWFESLNSVVRVNGYSCAFDIGYSDHKPVIANTYIQMTRYLALKDEVARAKGYEDARVLDEVELSGAMMVEVAVVYARVLMRLFWGLRGVLLVLLVVLVLLFFIDQ